MPKHLSCMLLLTVVCLFYTQPAAAQRLTTSMLPDAFLPSVTGKMERVQAKLDKKLERSFTAFRRQEKRLWRKVSQLDSLEGKAGLQEMEQRYAAFKSKLEQPFAGASQYLPYLDTLKTSLKFLSDEQETLAQVKGADKQITQSLASVQKLDQSLNKSEELKAFMKEQRTRIREQLPGLAFAKELKELNKKAYYYSAQLGEYQSMLKDKKKAERKAFELLSKNKPFQEFMRKNSQLASLFRLPGGEEKPSGAALQGLQTRASVQQALEQRFGSGAEVNQMLQQNVQQAQGQLSELKSKLQQYSSSSYGNSSSDINMPDGFKPNNQKSKSFLKRLELGTNFQSQRARYYFPATSDIGLSLGYKLNDKSVIGVGASYKVGWGRGWDNIAVSHQGVGLRSYVDGKLKGSIHLSGGYEQNYHTEFHSIDAQKSYSAWQHSGLLGLTKKYQAGKKLKGNMQLLWDFLSYQQIPKTQAIVWRVGYNF